MREKQCFYSESTCGALNLSFDVARRFSDFRHDACINRLRMRYIQYLEEQRMRDERNYKLLAALDRVMNKLALISAKKDRLNVLRVSVYYF